MRVAPDASEKAILPAGRFGQGGEVQLLHIAAREMPGEQNKGKYYLEFLCQVDDPDQGRVFVNSNAMGAFNTQMEKNTQGSLAPTWLAQCGFNPQTTDFDDAPDEKGLHHMVGADGHFPMKVVIDVGVEEYKSKDGAKVRTNRLRGIIALQ